MTLVAIYVDALVEYKKRSVAISRLVMFKMFLECIIFFLVFIVNVERR
jgi:hypothetical protein